MEHTLLYPPPTFNTEQNAGWYTVHSRLGTRLQITNGCDLQELNLSLEWRLSAT